MAEQYRAEINIDGDAKGALSSIAAVEAALAKLDDKQFGARLGKAFETGHAKKFADQVDVIRKKAADLPKKFRDVSTALGNATSTSQIRNSQKALTSFRKELDSTFNDLNNLRANPNFTPNQKQIKALDDLERRLSEIDKTSGEYGKNAEYAHKRATTAAERRIATEKELARELEKTASKEAAIDKKRTAAANRQADLRAKQAKAAARLSGIETTYGVSRADLPNLQPFLRDVEAANKELQNLTKTPKARRDDDWVTNQARAVQVATAANTALNRELGKIETSYKNQANAAAREAQRAADARIKQTVRDFKAVAKQVDKEILATKKAEEAKRRELGRTTDASIREAERRFIDVAKLESKDDEAQRKLARKLAKDQTKKDFKDFDSEFKALESEANAVAKAEKAKRDEYRKTADASIRDAERRLIANAKLDAKDAETQRKLARKLAQDQTKREFKDFDSAFKEVEAEAKARAKVEDVKRRELAKTAEAEAKHAQKIADANERATKAHLKYADSMNRVRALEETTGADRGILGMQSRKFDDAIHDVERYEEALRRLDNVPNKDAGWLKQYSAETQNLASATGRLNTAVNQQADAFRRVTASQAAAIEKLHASRVRSETELRAAQRDLYMEEEFSRSADNGGTTNREVASRRLANAFNDERSATQRLAEARAALNSTPINTSGHDANVRAYNSALQDAATATRNLTRARQDFNRTNLAFGEGMRYAMYDAAQQQALQSALRLAVPVGSAVAFGQFETLFSDIQRTAGLDNMGTLANGLPALGANTTSTQAFRDYLRLGTQSPVALSDIFDTAVKAGSIGLEGYRAPLQFTDTISKFNTVADIASPEQSAESFGRIGNLLSTAEYDKMASAIVNVGTSAAATDDEILRTTEELAMAAAGANFSTEAIIGLAGGFASLAIPPERARSVMQQFVNTMSKGMVSTTPEIQAMASALGMSVDGVRDLWKTNPEQMFLKIGEAMSGLDDASMVNALDAMGIDGQRALPVFQAITKNIGEMGVNGNVLATSLASAAEGFNDTGILDGAAANKTNDLAGKFRILINSALGFAASFGASMAPMVGLVMDGLTNILNVLTSIIQTPIGGFFATLIGSLMTVSGILKGISSLSMMFRGGQMAMMSLQSMLGGRPGMGSLSTLSAGFFGRPVDYAPHGRDTGQRYSVSQGAVMGAQRFGDEANKAGAKAGAAAGKTASIARSLERMAIIAPAAASGTQNVVSKADQFSDGVDRLAGKLEGSANQVHTASVTAEKAGGRFNKMSSGFKQGFNNLKAFMGGGLGMASIGAMVGAAIIGAIVDAENQRTEEVSAGIVANMNRMFTEDPNTGKLELTGTAEQFLKASTYGIGNQTAVWDRPIVDLSGSIMEQSLANAFQGNLGSTLSRWNTLEQDRQWYQQRRGSVDDRNFTQSLETSMAQWGANFSKLETPEQQIAAMQALMEANPTLTGDQMGQFLDLAFKDNPGGFTDFVNGWNAIADTDFDSVFANYDGALRNALGSALVEGLNNMQTSGGDPKSAGMSVDTLVSSQLQVATDKWTAQTNAVVSSFQAQVQYQEALKQGQTYVEQYGQALSGFTGEWDATNEAHIAGFQVLSDFSLAAANATQQLGTDVLNGKASFSELSGQIQTNYDDFINLATSMGMSKEEAQGVAEEMGLLPEQVVTDWLMNSNVDATLLSAEDLLTTMDMIPEGKSVTLSAITGEAKAALIDAGYTVTTLPDGTIEITATTEDVKAKIDEITSVDGDTVTVHLDLLSEDAQTELANLETGLSELGAGESIVIDDISIEAQSALQALGFEISEVDGEIQVTVPKDMTKQQFDSIMDGLRGESVDVDVKFNAAGDLGRMLGGGKSGGGGPFAKIQQMAQDIWGQQDKLFNNPGRTLGMSGLTTVNAKLDVDTSGANASIGDWQTWVNNTVKPKSKFGADTSGAQSSVDNWALNVLGLAPKAKVNADTSGATNAADNWFLRTGNMKPVPLVNANTGPADGKVGAWFNKTNNTNPIPWMSADSSKANNVASTWFNFANRNPTPSINAKANTSSAESQLNHAARNRTSWIDVFTRNIPGGRSFGRANGGFAGYANGGFASGRYTGPGGKYDVAGTVHRGEYVIPKRDVDQRTKLPKYDALVSLMGGIPGYALGPRGQNAMWNNGTGGVTDLSAATIHAIGRVVSTQLSLDGQIVARSSSRQNRRSTIIGSS